MRIDNPEERICMGTVTTAGIKAANASKAMHDARDHAHNIKHAPNRKVILFEVEQHGWNAKKEWAIEYKTASRKEFAWMFDIITGWFEEEEKLDTNHSRQYQDDKQRIGFVETHAELLLPLPRHEGEPQRGTKGNAKSVGVDGERTELEKDGMHRKCKTDSGWLTIIIQFRKFCLCSPN